MPTHRKSARWVALLLSLSLLPAPNARAWNATGHRVVVSIAFRQLDEPTRARVARLLEEHPARIMLWEGRATNGPDRALNLLWNGSIFPDEARRGPFAKFNRSRAHYVNFRIMADEDNRIDPPVDGENVINSYVAHLRKLREGKAPIPERAVSLSWVLHQAGDIHQPLHAVARFSKALPDGDRGGNQVDFPNPRTPYSSGNNLHAYWDDLLGTVETPEGIELVASQVMAEYPRESLAGSLVRTNIGDWARESSILAVQSVYRNLDPAISHHADRPVGYEADALRVARRQVALAGYRLGDELERLFPEVAEPR